MTIVEYAKETIEIQVEELNKVKNRLGTEIEEAVQIILKSKGKVVMTGIGKSGLIGKKIAATLASTGTYSTFMNAAEGLHGDLGMIHPDDVVIAISNSGNSEEVVNIIPSIKRIGAKIIAMTGNKNSKLGKAGDVVLNIGVEKEACPMNIAPTSSTTATLVVGDALAACLIRERNFKPENFALYHPGGSLGRRLLTKVSDVMNKLEKLAILNIDSSIDEIVLEMSNKRLGVVCITDTKNKLLGIITEGDIRRALMNKEGFFELKAQDIMKKEFISITQEKMAMDALEMMEERENQISILPVINDDKLEGIVRIHDLLKVK